MTFLGSLTHGFRLEHVAVWRFSPDILRGWLDQGRVDEVVEGCCVIGPDGLECPLVHHGVEASD